MYRQGADYRPADARRRVKARALAWATPAFVLAAIFVLLGQWQLGRAREKESMVALVERAERLAPRRLAAGVVPGPGRPVRVVARGYFDPSHEVLLDNQTHAGQAGVRVLTPFRIEGSASQLLVDRGWLPVDSTTRRPAAIAAPSNGETELRGLLTALPGVGVRMGDGAIAFGTEPPLLAYLDQSMLRSALGDGLVAGLLRLDADLPDGFLRDYQPVPASMPPARHRGYALQWFALAATVVLTWGLLAFRRP